MKTIFWRTIKDRRVLLLIYSLAAIGLLVMYIGMFPSFSKQTANLEQLLKSYPESLMKAFNIDIKSYTTIEGFLSTEQFSLMWPLIAILMSIGFSGYALAGEIEKGTIEILLSEPINRLKLFISRYLAGLSMLVVFIIFSVFTIIPISKIFNISLNNQNVATMAILAFLFIWAIYSIAMMFSAIFSDRGKVYFVTGMTLVVMYILNIVSAIRNEIVDIKYASFFYYFNPTKALAHNEIDHWSYLVFIGVAVICTIIGAIYFTKRNITT